MPLSPDQRRARAKRAIHARWHPGEPSTDPEVVDFERDLNERAIQELLARAPQMSDESCAEVRRLLGLG